jgi:hypothetical protein
MSGTSRPSEPLSGLIKIDGPRGWRLTADQVLAADPGLASYMGPSTDRNEYFFVYLAASFTAVGSRRLESARLKITLTAVPDIPAPFALSMKPLTDGDPVSVVHTAFLGPKFKLLDVAEAEIGHIEMTESFARTDLVVRGLPNGSQPSWEFTRTATRKLSGACTLQMVVQAGLGAALNVTGEMTARATLGSAIWHFGAELPRPLTFAAVL